MTDVDPQWYFDTAAAMRKLGKDIATELTSLQGKLSGISNSAGNHTSAGHTWATAYDQAASDVFEAASLTAIAADNLGEMVHKAGTERLRVQNENSPGRQAVSAPALPAGSGLTISMHPTVRSTGGLHDLPEDWDIIEGRIEKKWADCDVGKIKSAGEAWTSSVGNLNTAIEAVPPMNTTPDPPPEVPKIDKAVNRVTKTLDEVRLWGQCIASSCDHTQSKSDLERKQIKAILLNARIIIAVLENLPGGPAAGAAADYAVEKFKDQAAKDVTTLLTELDGFVAQAADNLKLITNKGNVTSLIQFKLAPLLGRYARPDKPVAGNGNNRQRGADGERRAGIPPGYKKRRVYPSAPLGKGGYRYPDHINDDTRQITEVKNTNDTRDSDNQIIDEANWAAENGYTMTLITDHRTTLSPEVEKLQSEGKITVLRMELDENLGGQKPTPFIPTDTWVPPPSDPTKPKDSIRTGVPTP
ncbi:putative toxin [Tsukamurella strandjordii]|uniref:putative toxin n=1 Tax=Tsukamurella TaxID=2060 RepID=UPI001C7CABDB|nr:putative toxin [Tsukamurella sp. TY48]GIZ98040.1 hypothetical protein TTY48_26520 [Tsukamurella sp. TY48]